MAEGAVGTHLNTVLRLVVGRSPLLVSVRKDHELDRFLLEKQKQESSAKSESAAPPMTPSAASSAISARRIFAGSARQIHAPAVSAAKIVSSRRDTVTYAGRLTFLM